ncbi:MAG: ATP-binding protein, partial [Gammaproteobacteria bacterium]|nr:ATP-binding protein [Gammaproteobacteria bacterium]
MFQTEQLNEKWQPVLEHADLPEIKDSYKRAVTTVILENQEKAFREDNNLQEAAPANATGSNVANWDPVLISLVRRAMPSLIAYDVAGVQPMTGPTGLIFAMKSRYTTQGGTEALFNEPDTDFTGAGTHAGTDPSVLNDTSPGTFTGGTGMATATGEALGDASGNYFPEMAFSIESTSVTAKTRALKAEYTMELAHDLKAVHGLDAESELANILSQEILGEINREMVRTVYVNAVEGSQDAATAGTIVAADLDGRWSVEKYKGLMFWIEKEANKIAIDTRRGKGNILICSSNIASALAMVGNLDFGSVSGNLSGNVDPSGNTFVGTLNGSIKVFVDPYSTGTDYFVVGYKGASQYDAGMFYCPYVPLQMVKAVGEQTFQPKIAFKTRYGMVDNPFVT